MSDYEKTLQAVQSMELKHAIDEMRTVRIEDGRNTITEIQLRNPLGEWGTVSVGVARRHKGDRRDPGLGGCLALYRALVNLTERHREAFAQKWPQYFPKTPKEVIQARAAVLRAREDADAAEKRTEEAETYGERWYDRCQEALALMRKISPERADLKHVIDVLAGWAEGETGAAKGVPDRVSELERRIEQALELLEASPEAWLGSSNDLTAAAHVLRGGDAEEKNPSNERGAKALKILEVGPREVDCGEGRTVVEAWSLVASRALAVLRGESDGDEPNASVEVRVPIDGRRIAEAVLRGESNGEA